MLSSLHFHHVIKRQGGIVMQAWYPLGDRGYTAELLNNETITQIADAHGKSSVQVIFRWDLQKGVVVIPGSSNPDHIKENISIFDFELTDEEMNQIRISQISQFTVPILHFLMKITITIV